MEGLFDYAVVWQAGFRNVTCSLGNHLNARQFQQLCDGPRTVYLAFDSDTNGAANLPRNRWRAAFAPRAYRPGASLCRTGTIRTASLYRVVMRHSFSGCWRPLAHDIPRRLSAEQ